MDLHVGVGCRGTASWPVTMYACLCGSLPVWGIRVLGRAPVLFRRLLMMNLICDECVSVKLILSPVIACICLILFLPGK